MVLLYHKNVIFDTDLDINLILMQMVNFKILNNTQNKKRLEPVKEIKVEISAPNQFRGAVNLSHDWELVHNVSVVYSPRPLHTIHLFTLLIQ